MVYDVIIIGAGVSGAFAARELSRYKLDLCIVEKESDVAMGTSKANSAIVHSGYDAKSGSLKARLNVQGNKMMERVSEELDVPFRRIGSLVLAFDKKEMPGLIELMERGRKNGVKDISIISKEQIREMEPNISQDVHAGLYAPSAGIICPYELTVGAVENAVENGAELMLECEVKDIEFKNHLFTLDTARGKLCCRYIVNAAGLHADTIAAMAGDGSFSIKPRKGEYILFDKTLGKQVNRVIFQVPSEKGKGILVTPTVDGNLLIGPNAEDVWDKKDVSTTFEGLEQVIQGAEKSVPGFSMRDVITSFAGLRARSSAEDFIIKASNANKRFINVAGIESPGLSAAPAIGEYVVGILESQGLQLHEKESFKPDRRRVVRLRELTEKELADMVKADHRYGRIVCRCEKVSEGEIIDCINRPAGARNLDAVKRRTRSGMGRCQGGFCSPRIVEILARELGIPMEKVTKMGGKSRILAGRTK